MRASFRIRGKVESIARGADLTHDTLENKGDAAVSWCQVAAVAQAAYSMC